ncbi:hypothetical protein C9426_14220 [Serratia sp. S1B]|nr:hypothetical protein C9426_14220 [Serratia sp. S1B]
MSYDANLARQFRDVVEKIGYYLENISHDEEIIERITDKNEWSIALVNMLYKIIIGVIYFIILLFVCAIVDSSWWVNLICTFVVLVVLEVFFFGAIVKGNAEKRIKAYQQELSQLEVELGDLIEDKLLPEIYPLGMVTVRNIIDKTSARYLPVECVEDFMDQEVKRGNFTKIKLKNDILYKGTLPQSIDNIETIVLEVD